jgi:hypothetical protein
MSTLLIGGILSFVDSQSSTLASRPMSPAATNHPSDRAALEGELLWLRRQVQQLTEALTAEQLKRWVIVQV